MVTGKADFSLPPGSADFFVAAARFLLIFCEIFIIRLWMNARKSFGRELSKQNNAKSEAWKVFEWGWGWNEVISKKKMETHKFERTRSRAKIARDFFSNFRFQ